MEQNEIKNALRIKSVEWEMAFEMGKSYQELLQIYKEIKELQYDLVKAQLNEKNKSDSPHLSPGITIA